MSVILCSGFDENLYSKVAMEGAIEANTRFVTLYKKDLPLTLAEIVAKNEAETAETSASELESKPEPLTFNMEYRYVIFSGKRKELDNVMQGFRKVYRPVAGSVIYAMLTSTAQAWTLQKYLAELGEEHKQMRLYRQQRANGSMFHEQPKE